MYIVFMNCSMCSLLHWFQNLVTPCVCYLLLIVFSYFWHFENHFNQYLYPNRSNIFSCFMCQDINETFSYNYYREIRDMESKSSVVFALWMKMTDDLVSVCRHVESPHFSSSLVHVGSGDTLNQMQQSLEAFQNPQYKAIFSYVLRQDAGHGDTIDKYDMI